MLDQYSILVACHSQPIYRELKSPYVEICSATSGPLEPGYEYYVHGVPGLDSRPESFSELSVLLNPNPFIAGKKLIGFVHYRRIFSLNPSDEVKPVIDIEFSHRFSRANTEASFLELYLDMIVIPIAWDQTRDLLLDFRLRHSVLEDALTIACSEFDIQASKLFGAINSTDVLSSTTKIYPCNMWLGNKRFYEEWTSLILPVLKRIESSGLTLPDTGYQARWGGFITERLFTVYIHLCQQAGRWSIVERPIILFVENNNLQLNHPQESISHFLSKKCKSFLVKLRSGISSGFRNSLQR